MDPIRRRSLLTAGLLGAGAAMAGCTTEQPTRGEAPPGGSTEFDPMDWDDVRAQFPLDPDLVHLAAFVLATHPKPVSEAISQHREGLDKDTEHYVQAHHGAEDEVRRAAAEYLDTQPANIALTDSTTMGLGILYSGLKLRRGQEILTTEHDFYATTEALRLASERSGATVRRVRLYDEPATANETQIVDRLRAAIGPRTRVVAVTWVHSGTGVRLPVPAIGQAVAEANAGRAPADRALLCVDGVHGFGAVDADIDDLGCDFLATGTHKWLFGPRGTGLLWGRSWEALAALIPTFSGGANPGAAFTPGGYHSFEHRWAAREAFEFHQRIGRGRIAARIAEQASQLKEGLAGIDGIRLVTPTSPDLSAGVVCCEVSTMDAYAATATLRADHRIAASVTPYAQRYLRFGPSMVTTPEQIDRTIEAVGTLV
ncbi:MAG: aminotransferase class V-fold PLP-dependent enzyme [Actinophytocola sp.]|uniref:aminotransferase class V-fold PLP-dependent enzyme n=1 Tax=Actinophytocola sp. TaxID=1872138 RepID=UPI00132A5948|nr:aminotransferase class V-fold PLP-dependent enzyme [Actinophytocola sp.]MPZ80633.1 aminotransferase class V-fold PLP-dependent enzyme [Actinophytocola sp.]